MILQNLEEKEKEGLGILLHICNDYEYQSLCMFQRMVPEYDLIVNRRKSAGDLRYGRRKVYVIY